MKITFAVGNLGRDAEIKNINGKDYISFRLALKDGREETRWANVLIYKASDTTAQYLTKGKPVAVAGRSVLKVYTGKDGQAHIDETIWADRLAFVSTQKEGAAPAAAPAPQAAPAAAPVEEGSDDLPF